MSNGYWGYHLILDCRGCDKSKVKDGSHIAAFVKHLVDAIDMKAYGEPLLEHFANHDPEKGGYSLVQLIETSAITGHFVDLSGDVYLDIFSCKEYSIDTVKEIVTEYFSPEAIKTIYLTRQA